MEKLTKSDIKNGTMTYSGIVKLRNQLVAENDPSNNELISFYNMKLTDTFNKHYKIK